MRVRSLAVDRMTARQCIERLKVIASDLEHPIITDGDYRRRKALPDEIRAIAVRLTYTGTQLELQ